MSLQPAIGSKEIAAAGESYGGAIEVSMRQCSIVKRFGGHGFGAAPQAPNNSGLTAVAIWAALLFAITLGGSLPFILAGQNFDEAMGSGTLPPLGLGGILLIAYAPTLAALFVTALTADAGGKNNPLRKLTNWCVAPAWYALVLLAPFVMVLAADGIYALAGGASPRAWLVVPDSIATSAFWGPLVAGSLGEEPGWRGFALPRLQSRLGALPASILIGILWGTWHLWPAITPGGVAHLTAANLVQTYLRLISTSILYAWLFNSTNGSLVLMMVAHAGHNLAIDFVPMPEKGAPVVALIVAFLYMAAALAVVLSTDPRTLTRAKSGG